MWKLHKNTTRLFVICYKWKRIDGMKNVFLMQNVLGTRSNAGFNCLNCFQYFFRFFLFFSLSLVKSVNLDLASMREVQGNKAYPILNHMSR